MSFEGQGVLAAVTTPLDAANRADVALLAQHSADLLRRGLHGITLFGTTGEGAARSRFAKPTKLTNIYAIMHGTATSKNAPWVLVTGHMDSRVTDVMDSHADAPGANDDASGVAVSLESARVLSKLKLPGTIGWDSASLDRCNENSGR